QLSISVRDNLLPRHRYAKPKRNAGVPHVEAPQEVLEAMVNVHIHLDDVTEENAPLRIIPGSHHSGKALHLGESPPQTILANRGDVLLIRPLVAHSSVSSHAATKRHRRILHLDFAASL